MNVIDITQQNFHDYEFTRTVFNQQINEGRNIIVLTTQINQYESYATRIESNMSLSNLINFLKNNICFKFFEIKLCGVKILVQPIDGCVDFDFEAHEIYQVNISRVIQWTLKNAIQIYQCYDEKQKNISIEICNSTFIQTDLIKNILTKCSSTRIILTNPDLLNCLDQPIEKELNNTLVLRANCFSFCHLKPTNYTKLNLLYKSITNIFVHDKNDIYLLSLNFPNLIHLNLDTFVINFNIENRLQTIKFLCVNIMFCNNFVKILTNNTSIEHIEIHEIIPYNDNDLQIKINSNFKTLHILKTPICVRDVETLITSNIIDLRITNIKNSDTMTYLFEKYPDNFTLYALVACTRHGLFRLPNDLHELSLKTVKKNRTLQSLLDVKNTVFRQKYSCVE